METCSLAKIKKDLARLNHDDLVEIVSNMAKFTRDNKMFLYFQIYGKDQPSLFTEMVLEELKMEFLKANKGNYFSAKKSAQGIRRKLNKYLKFTRDKSLHVELIAYYCKGLYEFGYLDFAHPVIENIYQLQIGKMEKILSHMHEDLQFDYQGQVEALRSYIRH